VPAPIDTDAFTATTPRGPIPVRTIIGKFNVTSDPSQPVIILAGHPRAIVDTLVL
jgi:hypothetical protein